MGIIYHNGLPYCGGGSGSSAAEKELTYAEYLILTEEEKNNGTTYYITDVDNNGNISGYTAGDGIEISEDKVISVDASASQIKFDDAVAQTGLANVQEVVEKNSSDITAMKQGLIKSKEVTFTVDMTSADAATEHLGSYKKTLDISSYKPSGTVIGAIVNYCYRTTDASNVGITSVTNNFGILRIVIKHPSEYSVSITFLYIE